MIETIQTFLQTIKERKHVLQLIQSTDKLMIHFISGPKTVPIALINGEFSWLHDTGEKFLACEIEGEGSAIQQLLEGKEKLRFLVKIGRLKVKAPFRTILMLESIFYLTKVGNELDQII
ncbi:hypothetical protein [Neobacillus ginsengisoli]|uniref:SCP2 domain-containing protein n=1 Tax=Neobacillus ginsengisoli TaxID=904295 RepID=A0ABT9XTL1_9BACI|nr:hypothetical protein [Neobacillus ginsengisoli]MDQ0198887.1 hypothetical protein [Neobacillus ginsengisoli]